jgi:hypothetical protein
LKWQTYLSLTKKWALRLAKPAAGATSRRWLLPAAFCTVMHMQRGWSCANPVDDAAKPLIWQQYPGLIKKRAILF